MIKNNLKPTENKEGVDNSLLGSATEVTEESLFSAVVYVGIAMGIGALINIIVDYILIKNFNMAVEGAAIATISSQFISFLFSTKVGIENNNLKLSILFNSFLNS